MLQDSNSAGRCKTATVSAENELLPQIHADSVLRAGVCDLMPGTLPEQRLLQAPSGQSHAHALPRDRDQ